MAASMEQIRELREATSAGIMDAKKALEQNGGDMEKAKAWLMEKGLASAAKKADREANEGLIEVYTHGGGRMAVLVEVNCETDFVAKTDDFKALAHEIAIQIASTGPNYVRKEDIPADVLAAQTEKFKQEIMAQGKAANIAERAAAGKLDAWYKENVLYEQAYVKDDAIKMEDMVKGAIAKLKENIVVRRFTRYQLGGM